MDPVGVQCDPVSYTGCSSNCACDYIFRGTNAGLAYCYVRNLSSTGSCSSNAACPAGSFCDTDVQYCYSFAGCTSTYTSNPLLLEASSAITPFSIVVSSAAASSAAESSSSAPLASPSSISSTSPPSIDMTLFHVSTTSLSSTRQS